MPTDGARVADVLTARILIHANSVHFLCPWARRAHFEQSNDDLFFAETMIA